MNWLDTQTKELLQKAPEDKNAPAKPMEFALVLLRKGLDEQRLVAAISEINRCSASRAAALASGPLPLTLHVDLSEERALWAQFQLICCDAVSVFVRTEVVAGAGPNYLWPLYKKILDSTEFRDATITLLDVPANERGDKFLAQFVGAHARRGFPLTLRVTFKKARIMHHWAGKIGAQVKVDVPEVAA